MASSKICSIFCITLMVLDCVFLFLSDPLMDMQTRMLPGPRGQGRLGCQAPQTSSCTTSFSGCQWPGSPAREATLLCNSGASHIHPLEGGNLKLRAIYLVALCSRRTDKDGPGFLETVSGSTESGFCLCEVGMEPGRSPLPHIV